MNKLKLMICLEVYATVCSAVVDGVYVFSYC